ncbi:hypothetical protein ACPW96_21680 [Micromonospora sp. DT81.3]|uniref:hypothetical protein n=1 Tax=Micromonospora sp. DT81.3 TaxID=3416523 RepID=UPI003CF268E1
MGNLGGYQDITKLIKAIGGPAAAVKYAAGAASIIFIAGGAAYAGGQKAIKAIKHRIQTRAVPCIWVGQVFTVNSDAGAGAGLMLQNGDEVRILECDGDTLLVEVIGNADNPYAISGELLQSISDFPGGVDTA